MTSTDWLKPGKRNRLEFARTWLSVFNEETTNKEGQTVKKYQAWLIPDRIIDEFSSLFAAAEQVLILSETPETRTIVINQQVKTTSGNLADFMRLIKRRFVHNPPMLDSDIVSLGLRVRKRNYALVGVSRTVPTGVIQHPLLHVIRMHIVPVDKTLYDRRSARYVCCRYGILDPAQEGRKYIKRVPVSPDDLPEQEDRRKVFEEFHFKAEDAGKKVYFCIKYMNSKGESGDWGPIIDAVIT